jgi:23S rRNA (adenine1618-N6)-methyltransferase
MSKKKKNSLPVEKSRMHPRNKHLGRYDLDLLSANHAELKPFIRPNKYGDDSIDFADPEAVKSLNKALLKAYYGINFWDIPEGYLCPPIPGRADYIHHVADLLCSINFGKVPTGQKTICLDVGVGANCIYPIIGNHEYGWSFIGSDIDEISVESAKAIATKNGALKGAIELRLQTDPKDIFYGVIKKEERIDVTICNPPFHSSKEEAEEGSLRKVRNLTQKRVDKPTLNFGGQGGELWCEGGEKRFIKDMIRESKKFRETCFWFTTLVSKQSNLSTVQGLLKEAKAEEVRTIPMGIGNKTSRIVAWTFLTKQEQQAWREMRKK